MAAGNECHIPLRQSTHCRRPNFPLLSFLSTTTLPSSGQPSQLFPGITQPGPTTMISQHSQDPVADLS
ncbi:hypothetical protein BC936DRAFT_140998, partial [Jimgerdemannia flammicorona]